MAANLLSWVSCIAVPILVGLVGLVGCSRSQDDSSAHAPASAVTPAINHVDLFRQYDPASLVEVTKFSGLPEGLRTMIRVGNVTEDHVLSDDDPGGGPHICSGRREHDERSCWLSSRRLSAGNSRDRVCIFRRRMEASKGMAKRRWIPADVWRPSIHHEISVETFIG